MSLFDKFFGNKKNSDIVIKAIKLDRERKEVSEFLDIENYTEREIAIASSLSPNYELKEIVRESDIGFQLIKFLWSSAISVAIDKHHYSKEIDSKINKANACYTIGDYLNALILYNEIIIEAPKLYELLFFYMRRCEQVLSTTHVPFEIKMDEILRKDNYDRKKSNLFKVRCKWCGRYTEFLDPNKPTYGLISEANCCEVCSRMYPTPSIIWDSPSGRAYSYFRRSFVDLDFYKEFESDYEPLPRITFK